MLGNPGSNQLELFWDVVDTLDQKLDAKIAVVENAIKTYNGRQRDGDVDMDASQPSQEFAVGSETTEEEFIAILKQVGDNAVEELGAENLHIVFVTVGESFVIV